MKSRDFLFLDLGQQVRVETGIMVFKFDRRQSIDFENGFVPIPLFILGNGEAIPDIAKVDDIVGVFQRQMPPHHLSKMHRARQKVLGQVLWDAGDPRALEQVFGWQEAI